MTDHPQPADWRQRKLAGWVSSLARLCSGSLLFLTVSGLAVFLLPFSVFNQHALLVHTALGVIVLLPLCLYLYRHVRDYWTYPLTQTKFTGWVAGGMTLVCCLSGLWLTGQAVFGTHIGSGWRMTHILTTFGLLLFLVPHLVVIVLAETRQSSAGQGDPLLGAARSHLLKASGFAVLGLLLTGALCLALPSVPMDNSFPDDYVSAPAGPFVPSLARTNTGGAFDSRTLSNSSGCGTSGCHPQIYAEWQPSAHRYAAMDAGFQAIQGVMATQNGPESTRYCGGCHDPISLFAGAKRIGVDALTGSEGYHEGISCLSCHAIEQTDVKGNANYVMSQPERYVFEQRTGDLAKFLSDFLIRSYPAQHVNSLSRRMFKTPEFCAACHKQFIDAEVNQVGWVQLQNQYDNWRASRWNHPEDPTSTIECRECHMPLQPSQDPAAGDEADFNRTADDGMHRSHRFLGGNQFIPTLHELEGAEEHVALTESWLRGDYEVPELADRWRDGPAVPIALSVPAEVAPGDAVALRVHVTNNKVGHDFPTGPLDIIQAWIDVEVVDETGRVLFKSGGVDDAGMIDTGSFMFKAEPVDRYGNLIDRHNLWEMVGVRFKRSLFPGAEEVASYEFACPGTADRDVEDLPRVERITLVVPEDATGELTVRARLLYRKFDQYLLDYAFGADSGLTARITELSSDEARIQVRDRGPPAEPVDG